MNQLAVQEALKGLPLGHVQFFPQIGSTNDLASSWAERGAPDLALVVADEQTAGRGRAGRRWYSPRGAALSFSLIMHPGPGAARIHLPRYTGLGALAVCQALETFYDLKPLIKWPNDVLLYGHKAAGVLVEARWTGEEITDLILGIGVNMADAAVPPSGLLDFPATSVEAALQRMAGRTQPHDMIAGPASSPLPGVKAPDRLATLRAILEAIIEWRDQVGEETFLRNWEARLAYRGAWVSVERSAGPVEGQVLGLDTGGRLVLRLRSGESQPLGAADLRIRPVGGA